MLTIDGSYLEGGGQIVRTAVALSATTGSPVTIVHIRDSRDRPGLAAQHMAAVRAVAGVCGAQVDGLTQGSRSITFNPGTPERRDIALDLGTAGSIPLVLQAWLPVAVRTGGSITLTGGTEVHMSPTIDYFEHVLASELQMAGASIEVEVLQRGYYPRGGGQVRIRVAPATLSRFTGVGGSGSAGICSCSSGLPPHVAERQAAAALRLLSPVFGPDFNAVLDQRDGPSTGSSVTAWMGAKGGIALGKRGLPAEKVGEAAARQLIDEIERPGMVDVHLSDQLLVYLAQYGGCYSTHTLSPHAATVCWLLEQFGFPVEIRRGEVVEFSA